MSPIRGAAAGRRSLQAQTGFTIVESLIALGLVFGVVVGLLATVNIGIRGVITGRQRSVALSIANEVMETARSRSYADVGHDLDSDPTLATDTAISGTVPNLLYANPAPRRRRRWSVPSSTPAPPPAQRRTRSSRSAPTAGPPSGRPPPTRLPSMSPGSSRPRVTPTGASP